MRWIIDLLLFQWFCFHLEFLFIFFFRFPKNQFFLPVHLHANKISLQKYRSCPRFIFWTIFFASYIAITSNTKQIIGMKKVSSIALLLCDSEEDMIYISFVNFPHHLHFSLLQKLIYHHIKTIKAGTTVLNDISFNYEVVRKVTISEERRWHFQAILWIGRNS